MVLTVFRPKFAWFSVIWRVGCVKAKTSLKRNEAWVLVVLVSSLVMLMILVLMVFWVGKARCAQGRGRQGWALVTYSGGTRHSIRKLLAPSRNQWWWIRSTRCPTSTPHWPLTTQWVVCWDHNINQKSLDFHCPLSLSWWQCPRGQNKTGAGQRKAGSPSCLGIARITRRRC